MPKPISFGKININVVSSMEEAKGKPEPETPFRVAVLGDFSGRTNRGIHESALSSRKPLFIDRDNVDDVMKKLGVEIRISILAKKSPPVIIRLSELDDLHPDQLFEKLEVFRALRDTRKCLKDPSTFESMAKKLHKIEKAPEPAGPGETIDESVQKIAGQTSGDLLDNILDQTQDTMQETSSSRGKSDWGKFLHQIVGPHLVPDIEPKQTEMIEAVDSATGELMRLILHHPDFQAIEAAWRGLHFLVSRLETDEQLKLYLIDISKGELAANLRSSEDLRSTGIYKLIVSQTVETFGGEPWAVLVGNYTFDQTVEDVASLGRMAKIAKSAGAPFIAAASDRVIGCDSLAETPDPDDWKSAAQSGESLVWEALRKIPEASYLGLALPRFLLRLPYGEETDSIERFEFEEILDAPNHDHYLWGNTSFTCVYLLGQTFTQYGWNFQSGIIQDIESLPLHMYKEEGETKNKACAEVVFTERAVEIILDKGIMPIISYKNQDSIRLARFQSLSDPPTQLAGRWT